MPSPRHGVAVCISGRRHTPALLHDAFLGVSPSAACSMSQSGFSPIGFRSQGEFVGPSLADF
jgi:hypothetical protein